MKPERGRGLPQGLSPAQLQAQAAPLPQRPHFPSAASVALAQQPNRNLSGCKCHFKAEGVEGTRMCGGVILGVGGASLISSLTHVRGRRRGVKSVSGRSLAACAAGSWMDSSHSHSEGGGGRHGPAWASSRLGQDCAAPVPACEASAV